MASKEFKSRIVHKHDTEANFLKATNFVPQQGEIIIYDIDATHTQERMKIGDGKTNVNALPFVASDALESELNGLSDAVDQLQTDVGNHSTAISDLENLVGDTSVSSQINEAVSTKADADHDHAGVYSSVEFVRW